MGPPLGIQTLNWPLGNFRRSKLAWKNWPIKGFVLLFLYYAKQLKKRVHDFMHFAMLPMSSHLDWCVWNYDFCHACNYHSPLPRGIVQTLVRGILIA